MADSSFNIDSKLISGDDLTISEPEADSSRIILDERDCDARTVDMNAFTEGNSEVSSLEHLKTLGITGRYVIHEVIGRGGVGIIHRGRDIQLQRDVAIKVLRRDFLSRPEILLRFMNEARITSRLQHPGVIPVHEFGVTADHCPYFIMRLMAGQTLDTILKRRTSPADDLPYLLTIFCQVSQAIAYAHSQRVIHRDIKTSNIMVGNFGVVKVLDWGLAKFLGDSESSDDEGSEADRLQPGDNGDDALESEIRSLTECTMQGSVFGTPAYMPPEQARGEIDRIDERSDVFGLGGILCFILTGSPPYTGSCCKEIFEKAASADLADAFERLENCSAPADLLNLAKRCLDPDPGRRHENAAQVVADITAHLQSEQRRAERDLVRFFDLSLDMFCIAGTNGYFRRVNANFTELLGYSAEELTSRPFADFVHPDDRPTTAEVLSRISGGEPCIQFKNRYRHADGHYLWLEWNARVVLEERAIYAVARDVTERVERENGQRLSDTPCNHDALA